MLRKQVKLALSTLNGKGFSCRGPAVLLSFHDGQRSPRTVTCPWTAIGCAEDTNVKEAGQDRPIHFDSLTTAYFSAQQQRGGVRGPLWLAYRGAALSGFSEKNGLFGLISSLIAFIKGIILD